MIIYIACGFQSSYVTPAPWQSSWAAPSSCLGRAQRWDSDQEGLSVPAPRRCQWHCHLKKNKKILGFRSYSGNWTFETCWNHFEDVKYFTIKSNSTKSRNNKEKTKNNLMNFLCLSWQWWRWGQLEPVPFHPPFWPLWCLSWTWCVPECNSRIPARTAPPSRFGLVIQLGIIWSMVVESNSTYLAE